MRSTKNTPVDSMAVFGGLFFLLLLFNLLADPQTELASAEGNRTSETVNSPNLADSPADDPELFAMPYTSYVITQGLHGQSYGHLAIDLTGGKGAAVLSPINGEVTAFYIDQWNNTTLVIENQRYQVTLLHGLYEVQVGDEVNQGERIGSESNQGYTVDFQGRLCAGRDCGYHTHLNVYDKLLGENVNPLEIVTSNMP
jgi:murein DD-endopeptidase MepM/ murein hydrolase activator NlpD